MLPGIAEPRLLYTGRRTLVFRGIREADGARVIVKTLAGAYPRPEDRARLRLEYDFLQSLDDRHVVRPLELVERGNRLALILEDIGAEPVHRLIESGPMEIGQFIDLALQMAAVLGRVHRQGLIHKDVNPANFVYSARDGRVQLIDFDIATRLDEESVLAEAVQTIEGTLPYIAPEQTGRMNRALDWRADFYSLGVTFYELLTGRLPFESLDDLELLHHHLAVMPLPPHKLRPEIPEVLSRMLLKLLAKSAEDRYQGAFGLADDLERCRAAWSESGAIPDFELASRDRSDRFHIPQKLYGRESETEALLAAFDRAGQGRAEMILVKGRPGIGKTVLVNEVYKPMLARRGRVVAGKYDQLRRSAPYSAIIDAVVELMRQILGEPEEAVLRWRGILSEALGDSARVVGESIPEIEHLLGPQPEPPSLGGRQARNRFNLVFRQLIGALARPEHPLVIFIDDLQWADLGSLELLQQLLSDPELGHLLFIGAYRDNEVHAGHPLMSTLGAIREAGARSVEISLGPLGSTALLELVCNAFQAPSIIARPLAGLVDEKTAGNPFFVKQFLSSLAREGHLRYSEGMGAWEWDVEAIRDLEITDNVVDFLMQRMLHLAPESRQVIQYAACIGGRFKLDLLARISDMGPSAAARALLPALELGHVLPLGSRWRRFASSGASLEELDASAITFRFAHDRVQQAAYSLNSASDKVAAHLRIGRSLEVQLAASEPYGGQDPGGALFAVVSHLNLASRLMQDPEERTALADLNLRAGRQAKASAGYEAARGLFEAGIDLLPEDSWHRHRTLALALHLEAAEAAYGAQEFDLALRHADLVIAQAENPLEAAPAHYTRVEIFLARHELREAVTAGIEGMASLGIELLVDPSEAEVGAMIAETQALLAGHDLDAIRRLSPMDDPTQIAAMRLAGVVSVPFSFVSGNGFVGVVTRLIRITLEHGLVPESAFAFVLYSNILCGPMQQYELGYGLGSLAMELVDQMNAQEMLPRVVVSFETSVRHWRDRQSHSIPALLRGYQVGVEIGDFEFATLCAVNHCTQFYQSGRPLEEVERSMQDMTDAIARLLQHGHVFSLLIEHESVDNLMGRSGNRIRLSGRHFDEDMGLSALKAADDVTHLVQIDMVKAKMCSWFGDYEAGVDHALRALEVVFTTGWRSTMYGPLMYFSAALNILASEKPGEGRSRWGVRESEIAAALDRCLGGLRGVAEQGAMNYRHKLDLIEAELARLDGRDAEALQAYDRAIEGAAANGYMQEEALACERAGRFALDLGLKRIARSYVHLARDAWQAWGALAKVEQIEAEFDWLRRTARLGSADGGKTPLFENRRRATTSVGSDSQTGGGTFDLSSAIRATQAISGEIELRSLLATLMQVLVENAGADAGALVDLRGESPRVAATYRHGQALEILPGGSIEDNARISAPAVRYVLRTHQTLVLSDALEEGPLTGDRHLKARGVRSLICAPVVHMGQTTAVLYLENSQAVGAFTPARLELLQMLSAQVAISLENAQLYENLSGLNRSFARFVPQSFLGLLERQDMSEVRLGDQVQLEMTVLFSDVRGFSRRSEGQSPAEVFGLLNTYLSRMVPRIEEHGGLIDKYMGDSIMAIFPEPGGADRAMQSALAMLRERDALNAELGMDGGEPLSLGIGLHSGPVMLGTIGSEARMDGTIIGDAVNLASRVEGVTKQYGVALAVSEATVSALEYPSNYLMREMDRVKMVGREAPVTVYEVFEADPPERLARKRENLARMAEAIAQFRAKDIEGCEMACRMILMLDPQDEVAAMYLRRCEKIRELGLSPEDELVTALTEK